MNSVIEHPLFGKYLRYARWENRYDFAAALIVLGFVVVLAHTIDLESLSYWIIIPLFTGIGFFGQLLFDWIYNRIKKRILYEILQTTKLGDLCTVDQKHFNSNIQWRRHQTIVSDIAREYATERNREIDAYMTGIKQRIKGT